jgi:signal peptidase II
MGRHLRPLRWSPGRAGEQLTVAAPRAVHLWVVILVALLDQAVKAVVRPRLGLFDSIDVIPGLFSLTRVHNTGAAFGLMNSLDFPFKTAVMALVQTTALVGLAAYAATLAAGQQLTRVGLSFVIGGAIGNLIDRVAAGYVLDFFDFYWRGWHFWAFNIADASITIGVALMILDLLGAGRSRVSTTL